MIMVDRNNRSMKIVTISMELVVGDIEDDLIYEYLNTKLYTDPEFFGDFGPENIVDIKEIDEQSSYYSLLYFLLFCFKEHQL